MLTKCSLRYAAVASSSNDSCAITWHQWQAAYPTRQQHRHVARAAPPRTPPAPTPTSRRGCRRAGGGTARSRREAGWSPHHANQRSRGPPSLPPGRRAAADGDARARAHRRRRWARRRWCPAGTISSIRSRTSSSSSQAVRRRASPRAASKVRGPMITDVTAAVRQRERGRQLGQGAARRRRRPRHQLARRRRACGRRPRSSGSNHCGPQRRPAVRGRRPLCGAVPVRKPNASGLQVSTPMPHRSATGRTSRSMPRASRLYGGCSVRGRISPRVSATRWRLDDLVRGEGRACRTAGSCRRGPGR